MTKEERHLWYDFLKTYPERILRQKVIGRFIVDFYCAKAKLVIEIDGGQHFTPEGKEQDAFRTEVLEKYGLSVIRFANNDVMKRFAEVCEQIDAVIKQRISNF